jgi:hypothetical protein
VYELLYNAEKTSHEQASSKGHQDWATSGKGKRVFLGLRDALGKMSAADRTVLLFTAEKMVQKRK